MADIIIQRKHGMSLADARKAAIGWTTEAEEKFDMQCAYQQGESCDEVTFARTGVSGKLTIDKEIFEITAKLGFLLGAFKEKIEAEITKNLDALIARKKPAAAKPGGKKHAL